MKYLVALLGLVFSLQAERIAISGGRILDGTGGPAITGTVVINDGKIESVGPAAPPSDARVVDATGMTVLPGLFDTHTHLLASGARVAADWGKILKAYLLSGVTSVVDLSTYPEQFEPMRRLIAAGLPAPRILMAARLSSPGGHGAEGGRGEFHTLLVQTPREARAAVRKLVPYKPDLLKVFTDGWRYGTGVDMTSMDQATLSALVDEAHKNNLKVLTHTVTLDKAKIAARAGVDLIIHGIGDAPIDEELIRLMKAKNVGITETLAVYEPRAGRDLTSPLLKTVLEPEAQQDIRPSAGGRGEGAEPAARGSRWQNLTTNIQRFKDGGIPLASGTDAGMTGTYHGWAAIHEVELMVKSGLSPAEAIAAATGNTARYLGVDQDRGFLQPGKAADVLIVRGNPLENIQDLNKVARVFLGGKELDRDRLATDIASENPTPLPSQKAKALLDDFESENGRSRIDTWWLDNTDSGHDHSKMSFQRTLRRPKNHALTVLCQMAEKDSPACVMLLPLAKGSIEPVDASAFRGVEFWARGEGPYNLRIPTYATRGRFIAKFDAGPQWRRVRVPFRSFQRGERSSGPAWTGKDLLNLEFVLARKASEDSWLELDNVKFYK